MNNNRIVILGAAESGVGAAVLAKKLGYDVFVSDNGKVHENYAAMLTARNIDWEEGKHSEEKIMNASEIIKSPGIPDKAPLIKRIKAKGISIISEIEFALRHTSAKIIGITGTNGKTTTTMLTYHILKKAGLNVGLAGNVGKSLAMQVAETTHDYYVLELSSFQLDGMYHSKINIAVLLNITPDHLDRYDYDMSKYVLSKFRITQNQTAEDVFIYCLDDKIIMEHLEKHPLKSELYPFSIKENPEPGGFITEDYLTIAMGDEPLTMTLDELSLKGQHNLYNALAAGITASALYVRKEIIREALSDFQNVEHRLEEVTSVRGILFINDSKATNINSCWYALEAMTTPVVWIVGGIDKGNDYEMVMDLVKEKVKAIVCLGEDNTKIHKAFDGVIKDIVDTESAEEAVKAAYRFGKTGDTVLLSPCCASFDLFKNYEDRGRQFKQAVREL